MLFGFLAGCAGTDGERDYGVPAELCGVPVDREAVSRLLPSGEQIAVREKNPVPSRHRCQVNIDGKVALVASREWWEDGAGIVDVARGVPQLKSAKLTEDDSYLLTGTAAAKKVLCSSTEHPGHRLFVTVQVYADGVNDSAAVEKVMTSYARSVEDSAACR
ncbi:hypothetical protein [Streptomyces sp. JHA26]|uniref:hypothetical protein n=1 Tax=Streptomyces sp. JHA26 TaxID=1917143 RepID=UPI001180E258|nr:hypothetical protein [Streptomyces sp. JHA26]